MNGGPTVDVLPAENGFITATSADQVLLSELVPTEANVCYVRTMSGVLLKRGFFYWVGISEKLHF